MSPYSTKVEELMRALDIEKEKVRALESDLQLAREQDSRYAATVTEEIEKGEWSCEINSQFVSHIESLCSKVKVKLSRYRPEQAHGRSGKLRPWIFLTFGTRRW